MTQEDKELLLKDLCARLPYGTYCNFSNEFSGCDEILEYIVTDPCCINYRWKIDEVTPYLFPLSSMTEEQKIEEYKLMNSNFYTSTVELPDFYNKNHFDYRGLIEKGLAIDATGLNIY